MRKQLILCEKLENDSCEEYYALSLLAASALCTNRDNNI